MHEFWLFETLFCVMWFNPFSDWDHVCYSLCLKYVYEFYFYCKNKWWIIYIYQLFIIIYAKLVILCMHKGIKSLLTHNAFRGIIW